MNASAQPRVAVVGAGIVGTSIALALVRRGAEVLLVDRDEPGHGCSFGNSGAVSPASVAPLAMPGVLASVPGMLLDDESPLYLPLRYLPQALPWLARFVASARPAAVEAAAKKLHEMHAGALDAHEAMTRELGVPELFLRRGHLHLYPDAQALAKDAGGWRLREAYGFRAERLDRAGIEALEPRVAARYRVGMYLADHATIRNPFRYVQAMARAFADAGGRIVRGQVQSLVRDRDGWHLRRAGGADGIACDHAVVAAGAWSRELLAPLGVHLALESQRGYHLQFLGAHDLVSRTVVLADRKVFVTPMEDGLRVGGTVEIGGLHAPPDERRAAVLGRIARETFTGLDDIPTRTWMGHRPCMPDSVPVVGPAAGHPGLWLATGHGHLGLTDSLNTAQRIATALLGEPSAAARPTPALARA
ncbi:NAD(P)/FAD-dependent oxidoreductase [Ramlibacter rhizophilus]|uniref:FAD-dependent oxidoreductase n=1 Tax=Ramlibacter rhizophilus TaxID=1781167 RepID=A0A4Z0BIT2_9BURK|nr:FAD-dependent oxidoreductase [Ramlibacter rhizophilus]TFY98651.1 FAD-dependent oxidoreductase [Ramlibacter rhizophilus]